MYAARGGFYIWNYVEWCFKRVDGNNEVRTTEMRERMYDYDSESKF